MKHIYILVCLLICAGYSYGQATCGAGQAKVVVSITADNFPQETSWILYDEVSHTLIDSGGVQGDSACVATGHCLRFVIFDVAGDGLCCGFGHGSYTVSINGAIVARDSSFGNSATTYFNCPPGSNCSTPLPAGLDTITAPAPETWYVFTADSTGSYLISTCNLGNTCDTKLYIYDHCAGLIYDEQNTGTLLYDDDGCGSGFQARIQAVLTAGSIYYIRVGDYTTACAGQNINWQIQYLGPVRGCMDSTSCNYNPQATEDDSSCVYAPNALCAQPDLAIDGNVLESSMYVADLFAGPNDCYVSEGCLAGYGLRRLIRFSTHIRNIGNEDYYIGLPDTTAGQYVFDACHGHWHYVGYAEYLMYDINHQPLQQGFKNGFCVLDLECGGGGMAKYDCGNMGITAGCGDIYDAGLDCQWIDITDIDTGIYTLVVRVNWDQSPDRFGRYEKTYNNNWAQVCLHLYYDNGGYKIFDILPNCVPHIDCAGDTFGNAVFDCNKLCDGSGVRGDVDINFAADSIDFNRYLSGLAEDTITFSLCNDLNGDSLITVTDAARLNGCLLFNAGSHSHPGNYQNTHKHCEFPNNIYNPFDSVLFSIADTNLEQHYIDLSVFNPSCPMLAYEFKLHGLVVDSVKNLALGNYNPDIRSSAQGHVVGIAPDENALFKQQVPLNFMRVYFDSLTDTVICIERVIAVVNGNYEEVLGKAGDCVHIAQKVEDTVIISAPMLTADMVSVIPNPSTGVFQVYLQGKSLQGAALKVTDALGKVVYHNVNTGLSNHATLDISEQASGVYLLHIDLNGARMSKRLVLTR